MTCCSVNPLSPFCELCLGDEAKLSLHVPVKIAFLYFAEIILIFLENATKMLE